MCRLLIEQMTVDLLGVVTEVKPLGSVKRKSDQAELSRRDLTLVDQRWVLGAGADGCWAGAGGCWALGGCWGAAHARRPEVGAGWVIWVFGGGFAEDGC